MPPLPPSATTLAAFKSLLLDRLTLLRRAGAFHTDKHALGIPSALRHELDQQNTVSSATPTANQVSLFLPY